MSPIIRKSDAALRSGASDPESPSIMHVNVGDTEGSTAENSKENAAGNAKGPYDFSVIRNLRKAQGFTISDVSESSGISTAVISRIERNQAVPELETLARLGKAFGISATDLLALAEFRAPQLTRSQNYISGGFQFQHIQFMNVQAFVGTALGGGTVMRPEVHHNDHEICWVLSGPIEIHLNQDVFKLKEGEAMQFDSSLMHSYKASSGSRILILHLRKGRQL
jgi:transcriptional regulator with XRE-family HTH domain